MENSADPDQLTSSDFIWIYTICKGGAYPGFSRTKVKYRDRPAWANIVGPDQMPQNVASDQGLLCLPVICQSTMFASHSAFFDTVRESKWTLIDLAEVLRPSQPIRVMSSVVSLLNHTFPGQDKSSKQITCAHSFCLKLKTALLESAEGRE